MSTRWRGDVDEQARCSAACLPPFGGAVPSTRPPFGGIVRMTSHGTVAVSVTGACEISGAVTLLELPCCGQFSVAVVCTTGSSGVATDSTKPMQAGDRRHPAGDPHVASVPTLVTVAVMAAP